MITKDSIPERAGSMLGVPGRFMPIRYWPNGLFSTQTWVSEKRAIEGYGAGARMQVEVRYDDNCRNGHNTFSITATVARPRRRDCEACGCLHDDIAAVFPELAPLIKWHLVSDDGPMHYTANTVFHASDRDHWGARKGEVARTELRVTVGNSPFAHALPQAFIRYLRGTVFTVAPDVVELPHTGADGRVFSPHYTFAGFPCQWAQAPFKSRDVAEQWADVVASRDLHFVEVPTVIGEGKTRDLNAARSCAVWPDATDEELCAEPDVLRAALSARLPALMASFRAAMTAAGFLQSTKDATP